MEPRKCFFRHAVNRLFIRILDQPTKRFTINIIPHTKFTEGSLTLHRVAAKGVDLTGCVVHVEQTNSPTPVMTARLGSQCDPLTGTAHGSYCRPFITTAAADHKPAVIRLMTQTIQLTCLPGGARACTRALRRVPIASQSIPLCQVVKMDTDGLARKEKSATKRISKGREP